MNTKIIIFILFLFSIKAMPQIIWEPTNGPYRAQIKSIKTDNEKNIYAVAYKGPDIYNDKLNIFQSTDLSNSWKRIAKELDTASVIGFAISSTDILFLTTRYNIYSSSDNGKSWSYYCDNYNNIGNNYAIILLKNGDIIANYDTLTYHYSRNTNKWIDLKIINKKITSFCLDTDNNCYILTVDKNGSIIYKYSNENSITEVYSSKSNLINICYTGNKSLLALGDSNKIFLIKNDTLKDSTQILSNTVISSVSEYDKDNLILIGKDSKNNNKILKSSQDFMQILDVTPTPDFKEIQTRFIQNSNNLLLIYDNYKFYLSLDIGSNWITNTSTIPTTAVYGLSSYKDHLIIYCSTNFELFYSSNNGNNWENIWDTKLSGNTITNIFITSKNTVYAGTGPNQIPGPSPTYYRTRDTGDLVATQQVFGTYGMFEDSKQRLYSFNNYNFLFTDDNNNWIEKQYDSVAYKRCRSRCIDKNDNIYILSPDSKITDSLIIGKFNSNLKDSITYFIPKISSKFYIYQMCCLNDGELIIAYKDSLIIDKNKDNNWYNITNSLPKLIINCVFVDDNNWIWMATNNGIYLSTDKGTTWTSENNGLDEKYIFNINGGKDGYLYCVPMPGVVYRTKIINSITENEKKKEELFIDFKDRQIKLNTSNNLHGESKYVIYNILGSIIESGKINFIKDIPVNISLARQLPGVYIIEISTDTQIKFGKFLIN